LSSGRSGSGSGSALPQNTSISRGAVAAVAAAVAAAWGLAARPAAHRPAARARLCRLLRWRAARQRHNLWLYLSWRRRRR
jgi:hypothetical protein